MSYLTLVNQNSATFYTTHSRAIPTQNLREIIETLSRMASDAGWEDVRNTNLVQGCLNTNTMVEIRVWQFRIDVSF